MKVLRTRVILQINVSNCTFTHTRPKFCEILYQESTDSILLSFPTLKVLPRCRNVCYDVGDVTQDGGEGEQPDQELEYHKEVLRLRLGGRQVADRGHGQDGP